MGANRRGRNRRRQSGEFRVRPRSSPASLLVLTVSAVLLGTAAATALLGGGGFDDATPHGRLLGTLQAVAEAQESHYEAHGRFASSPAPLGLDPVDGVELVLTGDQRGWNAFARSLEADLDCSQSGGARDGKPVRDEAVCFSGH